MSSIIPAKDVGRLMFETLRECVESEMPNSTEAEREEAMARILNAMAGSMFSRGRK